MSFTKSTVKTNNISELANKVKGQATALKTDFDQYGIDDVAFTNGLIDELEAVTGAASIGINATGVVASNVTAAIEEVQSNVSTAAAGQIVDGSIEDVKLSATGIKAKVNLITVASAVDLADVETNTNATGANASAIDVLEDHHLYYDTTGTATAYILATTEEFDFTKNGSLRVNPHLTNTASSTIAVNGTTKTIKKYDIDTDAYISLEAEDVKKYNQLELRFDVANDFFVLAPKSGGFKKATGTLTVLGSSTEVITGLAFTPNLVLAFTTAGNISHSVKCIDPNATGLNFDSYCSVNTFVDGGFNLDNDRVDDYEFTWIAYE